MRLHCSIRAKVSIVVLALTSLALIGRAQINRQFPLSNPIRLEWDPSTSPEVAGYKLYMGIRSLHYSEVLDLGDTNSATLSNVLFAATNFIAVTAYDTNGVESDLSNELKIPFPRSNSIPVALDTVVFFAADTAVRLQLEATDDDGDVLEYHLLSSPQHGTLWGVAPDFIYLPTPGYTGEDDLSYVASDGLSESSPATVTLFAQPTQHQPYLSLGHTQTVHVLGDGPTILDATAAVTSSAPFEFAGSTLTVTIISNAGPTDILSLGAEADAGAPPPRSILDSPLGGEAGIPFLQYSLKSNATVALVEGLVRSLTFSPGSIGYLLPRTIRILLTDPSGRESLDAELQVLVDRRPQALADEVYARGDETTEFGFDLLLANDLDPDGDALAVSSVSTNSRAGGTVVISGSKVTYSPAAGFRGRDSFSYTAVDPLGALAESWAEVIVVPRGELLILGIEKSFSGFGVFSLVFAGEANRTYQLRLSLDLSEWRPYIVRTADENGFVIFNAAAVFFDGNFFFRAQEE